MNKENPKKNKKSFEYYIAQRKEEFRCQYDHERSWENLQYKLEKRRKRRISLYCVAASAALLFLILGISHIFSLHNNTQNKEAVVAAVISFPETGSRKAILTLENGEKVDLSVKKGTFNHHNGTRIDALHQLNDFFYMAGVEVVLHRVVVRRCGNDHKVCVGICLRSI